MSDEEKNANSGLKEPVEKMLQVAYRVEYPEKIEQGQRYAMKHIRAITDWRQRGIDDPKLLIMQKINGEKTSAFIDRIFHYEMAMASKDAGQYHEAANHLKAYIILGQEGQAYPPLDQEMVDLCETHISALDEQNIIRLNQGGNKMDWRLG